MKNKRIFILMCSFICHFWISSAHNLYTFQYLTLNEGLSHADANTLMQDSKGFIWIGTYSGLNRFDGNYIKSYYNDSNDANSPFYNRIENIDIDKNDKIWQATSLGVHVFDPVTDRFIHYKEYSNPHSKDTDHREIKRIKCQNNNLYLLDRNYNIHLYHINNKTKTLIPVTHPPLTTEQGFTLFKDNKEQMWIPSKGKIICISQDLIRRDIIMPEMQDIITAIYVNNERKDVIIGYQGIIYLCKLADSSLIIQKKIPLKSKAYITDIKQDHKGNYWVSTHQGLYRVQQIDSSCEFIHTDSGVFGLKSDYINQLEIDKTGTLFIATYAGGVNYLNLQSSSLTSIYQSTDGKFNFSGQTIRSIVTEGNNLYIGTHTHGIIQLDKSSYQLTSLINSKNMLSDDNIRAMIVKKNGEIWIAHAKGIEIISPEKKKNLTQEYASFLPHQPISLLEEDIYGQVWAIGGKKLFIINKRKKQTDNSIEKIQTLKECLYRDNVIALYSDHLRPEMIITTSKSLFRIFLDKEGNVKDYIEYSHQSNTKNTLKGDFICSAYRENDSVLWVGHVGNYLSRILFLPNHQYQAKNFPMNNHDKFKDFEGIQADKLGNIWIAGNGITAFNIKTKQYRVFSSGENKYMNSYKIGASYKSEDGNIFFGGNNGFTIIPPQKIGINPYAATPEITDIQINNKPLSIKQRQKTGNISYTDQITLSHDENNITIYYSAMHYAFSQNCSFKYQMTGVDGEEKEIKNASIPVNYSNLSPGHYIFKLFASNNDGIWNKEPRLLKITILPPWWMSTYMKMAYVLLVILLLYGIYRYFINLNTIKHNIKLQEIKEKQKEELHQMQLQLFTNISHEFRTPLTLISGIVEQVQTEFTSIKTKQSFSYLTRNVNRLLSLVNELMDFRKTEAGSFKLAVQKMDIHKFVSSIANEFESVAKTNQINYIINIPSTPLIVYADPKIVEKIVINLLNNAFKYCPSGTIEIEISNTDYIKNERELNNQIQINSGFSAQDWLNIRVRDTGIGISEESIGKVFERYYQIEDSDNDPHLGSGVGLALVKNLLILHKGKLTLRSKRNVGSEFIISFPYHYNDYSENEIKKAEKQVLLPQIPTKHLENAPLLPINQHIEKNHNLSKPRLLLVEDNLEIQSFLITILSKSYSVIKANDGLEAIKMMKIQKPDIILSDLMMPHVDGNKLCSMVKNNQETCDIPFILLTGKDDAKTQNESAECGADAFLNKPIRINLLMNIINNLYKRKANIQKNISQNYIHYALQEHLSLQDEELGEKIIDIIKNNMGNTQLDANFISRQLNISRSGLYQKSKDIFDIPIIELVRDIRLKKAIQIMSEENLSMAEIAVKTGFQNQSYFTASFKKKYGVTPTAYYKQLNI